LGAEGALQYVRFGKEIAKVDDLTIQNLKILGDKGKGVEMTANTFVPSQMTVIKEGPLCGLNCEVVRYKDKEKILVRVNLLNRCILVDLEVNHLIGA
jgi:transcription antitermination factor NusG